jgi:hypothetical protein
VGEGNREGEKSDTMGRKKRKEKADLDLSSS